MDRLAEAFHKSEERSQALAKKQMDMIRTQLEAFAKYLKADRNEQTMEYETTDSRKRNIKGKEKKQVDQDDFLT